MKKRKIAFFDWDGTLSADGKTVSAENRAAIAAFRAAGNFAGLCTGRCLGFLPPAALALPMDGVIAGAGVNVLFDGSPAGLRRFADGSFSGKRVYNRAMPDALVREMLDAYLPHGAHCCKLEGETGQFFLDTPARFLPLSPPDFEIFSANDFFARYPTAPISKATVFTADDTKPLPLPALADRVTFLQYERYEELCLPCESKASGIVHLLDTIGISRENTLAFGDSENDRAMLSFAAVSVAMATAPADLRALATRIAPPADESGVAAVLREYC